MNISTLWIEIFSLIIIHFSLQDCCLLLLLLFLYHHLSWKLTLILPELFTLIWWINDIRSIFGSKLGKFENTKLPGGSSFDKFDCSAVEKTSFIAPEFIGEVKFGTGVVSIEQALPFWYQEQELSLQIHLLCSTASSEQILKHSERLIGPFEQIQSESSISQESRCGS